ncbi:poly-gamma-glutamate hydrolase family protein [Streptomyces sp. NPDC005485]|uniref:poly-gamma-glutamate hydrolase family protein n=1 Tax=Streptomyces sp. NPDC005485 TaxID=3155591 RepID=UPI0033BA5918
MADLYASYTDLAAREVEGVDYLRRRVPVAGSAWASIAIHGGGIEPGSGEVARAVGAGLMTHYEFTAIRSTGNSDLHVTSTNFDEPVCQGVIASSLGCLSFHGFTGTTGVPETALGGLDTATADRVRTALRQAGFHVTDAARKINGSSPANIANRTTIGAGVQLELSTSLRASFFPDGDLTRAMRDTGRRTATFDRYVAAVRSVFEDRALVSQDSPGSRGLPASISSATL